MKKIKRFVSLFLSVFCAFSVFGSLHIVFADDNNLTEADLSSGNSPIIISNGTLRISFDKNDNSVSFMSDDYCLKSIPDAEITGINRVKGLSLLMATVINENGELENIYSFSNADYKVLFSKNKIRILFNFEKYKIKIPLDFCLTDDKTFCVSIPVKEIIDKKNILLDISFLPYLGAAGTGENGYILIPDGSGAAVDFGGKNNNDVCKYSIYGTDAMNQKDYAEINSDYINIPMYSFMYAGEKSSALTAYVEKGASQGSLYVSTGNGDCPYSTAYFSFNYRPYTLTTLLDRTSKAQKFYIASKNITNCDGFEVSYRYFNNSDATLAGISKYVGKKIFGNRKKAEISEMKAFLDVYLSVYKRVYSFGIPHNTNVVLTSLKDCERIAEDFDNPIMMLRGLDKFGAMSGPIDKSFSISKKIGNKDDFLRLKEKAQIYSVCEFTRFDKTSLGFSKLFNSSRSVTGKSLYTYFYNPATLLSENTKFNILEPDKIISAASKYIRSAIKNDVDAVSPITLGNSPYTNGNKSDRQKTADKYIEALELIQKNKLSMLLENPDAYSLKYAEKIISLPTSSSGQSMIDFDIPFIQMVVRDYLEYSGEPVNISGDSAEYSVLNCARTGSNLCFSITDADYIQIKDTELDFLYGSDYGVSGDAMKKIYKEYKEKMLPAVGKKITDYYRISAGVTVTVFSDGVKVYVNTTDSEYVCESGKTVKANDYYVEVS